MSSGSVTIIMLAARTIGQPPARDDVRENLVVVFASVAVVIGSCGHGGELLAPSEDLLRLRRRSC